MEMMMERRRKHDPWFYMHYALVKKKQMDEAERYKHERDEVKSYYDRCRACPREGLHPLSAFVHQSKENIKEKIGVIHQHYLEPLISFSGIVDGGETAARL